MFGSFVGVDAGPGRRRTPVARACDWCQRRKTKCDGSSPCANCLSSQVQCVFTKRGPRRKSSKPLSQTDSGTQRDYQTVFKRLFGDISVGSVKDLSRQSLLTLLNNDTCVDQETSPSNSSNPDTGVSPSVLEATQRLQLLEEETSQGFEWDETNPHLHEAVEDDVNGLALSADGKSSFLGVSSIAAVVRALLKVLPGQVQHNQEDICGAKDVPNQNLPSPLSNRLITIPQASYHEEQRLIDAYFANVHVFAPIIHERTFRRTYLSNVRKDSPWLALINMVLALGSIAISTSDSNEDIAYYQRAQQHLGLELFGSGHRETLQALILMGGLYCHYRNRPNMASVIMGATNRIACSLGLHREFHGSTGPSTSIEQEIHRRIWWSNYSLDLWGSTTLGRPPNFANRSVKLPQNLADDDCEEAPLTQPTIHSPLIHNVGLCKIISRIQNRLQSSPILETKEISFFDEMLVNWFTNLPSFMHPPNPCPPSLQDIRAVLGWRYQNMRILLHRPMVLNATIRQIPFQNLTSDEQTVVQKCREIASDSILSIKSEWRPNKMSCWNAVWFLFQACLIPLMALVVESRETEHYQEWRSQVETGIYLCGEMANWSLVGLKTKQFLQRLLQATESAGSTGGDHPRVEDQPWPEYQNLNESFFEGNWNDVIGQDGFSGFDADVIFSTDLFQGDNSLL